MLVVLLWVSAAVLTFGALASIGMIGKPREPITPAVAVFTIILNVVIITTIVLAALNLA